VGLAKEFREFAVKGSVVDLALGVIIGAAFGRIVDSLVKDILMPPLAVATGGIDFTNQFVTLKGETYATLAEAQKAGAITLNWGAFLNAIVAFLLVTLALFLVIRWVNRLRREEVVVVVPTTRACPECLSEIPIEARRCRFCAVAV
jgi:large conductance mechanosensitive channel